MRAMVMDNYNMILVVQILSCMMDPQSFPLLMFASSVFIQNSSFCTLINLLIGALSRTLVPHYKSIFCFYFYFLFLFNFFNPAHVVTDFGVQYLRHKNSSLYFGKFQILLCCRAFYWSNLVWSYFKRCLVVPL
jgi:hypothetical protein